MKSTSEDTNEKFITRKQLAFEIGLDHKTLRKRIKESGLELPKGLISPVKAREIRIKLGLYINSDTTTDK